MKTNKHVKTYAKALLTSLCLFVAFPSVASLTLVSASFSGNDCKKDSIFGSKNGFGNCTLTYDDEYTYGKATFKLDKNFDKTDGEFNHIDWDFSPNSNTTEENSKGTWHYTGNGPGIRFWTAKAGSGDEATIDGGFKLFWYINTDEDIYSNCIDPSPVNDTNFNSACLNLAKTVTSGDWFTPAKTDGTNRGLSHLTFFGGPSTPCTTNCGPAVVPEPQTLMLLALGMLGLVARQKRTTVKNS